MSSKKHGSKNYYRKQKAYYEAEASNDREPPKQKIRELCLLHPEVTFSAEARGKVPPETMEACILRRPALFLKYYQQDKQSWEGIIMPEIVAVVRALASGASEGKIDMLMNQLAVAKTKKKRKKKK